MRPAGDSMTPSLLSLLSRDLSTLWLLLKTRTGGLAEGVREGGGPGAWTRDLLAGSELAGGLLGGWAGRPPPHLSPSSPPS